MEQPVTPAPAAPAPAAPAPAISATLDAANRGSFSDFEKADAASRSGKPLAEVAAPVVPAKEEAAPPVEVPTAEKPAALSNRQQKTNDAIREAVERATAELLAENRLLRERGASRQPETPAQPEAPKKERFTPLADWSAKNPDGTLEDYMDARDEWNDSRRTAAEQMRSVGESLEADAASTIESFDARVAEAEKANPQIRAKISPLAHALGAKGGPFGVVARLTAVSEQGPQVLEHFADNPDALKRLVVLPDRLRGLPVQVQVEQHKLFIAHELGKLAASVATPAPPPAVPETPAPAVPSTITSAPPPPPSLSRAGTSADPKAGAIARGDFATFDKLDRQERIAAKRGA